MKKMKFRNSAARLMMGLAFLLFFLVANSVSAQNAPALVDEATALQILQVEIDQLEAIVDNGDFDTVNRLDYYITIKELIESGKVVVDAIFDGYANSIALSYPAYPSSDLVQSQFDLGLVPFSSSNNGMTTGNVDKAVGPVLNPMIEEAVTMLML